jgi:hypothetical protein
MAQSREMESISQNVTPWFFIILFKYLRIWGWSSPNQKK